MKEKIKVEIYVPFQGNFLQLEELGGINEKFIVFNPDYSGGKPDYKIQLTEKVLARLPEEEQLIPIDELPEEFVIINSSGKQIGNSDDLNPEFVDLIIEMIIDGKIWDEMGISTN